MQYVPENHMLQSERELRKEYTRLRDIGQKRLKRLMNSEFKESQTARRWKDGIPELKTLDNKQDLVFALYELESFINSPYSTVRGQRAIMNKIIKKLRKNYPTLDINKNNFFAYSRILNAETNNGLEGLFGSNRAVALFKVVEAKGIVNINPIIRDPASMAYWLDNLENLEAVTLPKERYKSAKAYKQAIEDEINKGRDRREVKIPGVDDIIQGKRKRSRRSRTTSRRRRS